MEYRPSDRINRIATTEVGEKQEITNQIINVYLEAMTQLSKLERRIKILEDDFNARRQTKD